MKSLSQPGRVIGFLIMGIVALMALVIVLRARASVPTGTTNNAKSSQWDQVPHEEQRLQARANLMNPTESQGLGISLNEFTQNFNKHASESGSEQHIDRFTITKGTSNWFTYAISDDLVLTAQLADDNEHIATMIMHATPKTDLQSTMALLCMSSVIMGVTPKFTVEDRNHIVTSLLYSKRSDGPELRETLYHGLEYSVSVGGPSQLIFGIERPVK